MVHYLWMPPGQHSPGSLQGPNLKLSISVFYFNHSAFLLFLKHFLNFLVPVSYSLCSLCLECCSLFYFQSSSLGPCTLKIIHPSEPLSDDITCGLSFLTLWPKVIPSSLPFFHQLSKYLLGTYSCQAF